MSELLDLAKAGDGQLEEAFVAAAADPARQGELLEVIEFLAAHDRCEQAEMLAWGWLGEAREGRPPAEALDLGRRMLMALSASGQLRNDVVALYRAAYPERPDLAAWLTASGLTGTKVSPQRACRALDLLLAVEPGQALIERTSQHSSNLHEHRLVEVVRADAAAGTVAARPLKGGPERSLELLRFGDEYEPADPDDFRLLARRDPDRLKQVLAEDPLTVLISVLRSVGGQMDADQLRDNLVPQVFTDSEYSKWWSRARAAARKSPNVRVEGRSPVILAYDEVGTSLEQESAATLARTWDPAARLELVETYLRTKAADRLAPDPNYLADVAARVSKWLAAPDAGLADALVARRLADLGVSVTQPDANRAMEMLAAPGDWVPRIVALPVSLWPTALELLKQAKPVGPAGPGPEDWQAIYLQLLAHAPVAMCDLMAAALIEAGQTDRLNAEIMAIAESPLEAIDGLSWLWIGPAVGAGLAPARAPSDAPAATGRPQGSPLQLPRPNELFDQLLRLTKQAETVALTDAKFAKEIRHKVRAALSARGYATFKALVETLPGELAPLLRRQIRRAEGLGITVPEQMLSVLDERHAPVIEAKPTADLWLREDVIYVSPEAMAAKEKELDQITNVEMPANSRAIAAAASHGDLSENSEYKFALEERDLLRARVARIQNELSMARVLNAAEVPTDHVSIYSRVDLVPDGGGESITLQIVSPWDGNVAERRFNYKAPISRNLLGRRVGDAVRIALDGGEEREYRIRSILPPGR